MTTEQKGRDAGNALDAEVAERVFGATDRLEVIDPYGARVVAFNMGTHGEALLGKGLTLDTRWGYETLDGGRLTAGIGLFLAKPFSSEIASAFLVVEAMRAKGWEFMAIVRQDGAVEADFESGQLAGSSRNGAGELPLAICRAALSALTPEKAAVESVSPASL